MGKAKPKADDEASGLNHRLTVYQSFHFQASVFLPVKWADEGRGSEESNSRSYIVILGCSRKLQTLLGLVHTYVTLEASAPGSRL